MNKSIHVAPPPKLSPEEQAKLVRVIKGHLQQIETGRKETVDVIEKFVKMHEGDYSWRVLEGGIWEKSNVGVPMAKMIATAFSAKIEDELIGSERPITVTPQRHDDQEEAEQQGAYWTWELMEQIRIGRSFSEACWLMPITGTAITKRAWRTRRARYPNIVELMVDAAGKPVSFPSGAPVNRQSKIEEEGHPARMRRMMGHNIKVATNAAGERVQLPEGAKWGKHEVMEEVVHYDNAEHVVIPAFADFYADITRASLDDCDFKGHLYRRSVSWLVETARSEGGAEAGWIMEEVEKTATAGRRAVHESVPKTDQAKPHLGENPGGDLLSFIEGQEYSRQLDLVECYLKYDANGDEIPENVVALYDKQRESLLWIDWLANVYEDCKDPFTAHSFFRIAGRWRGMGVYEYLKQGFEYIDKTFSRVNLRESMAANPMTWRKSGNFVTAPTDWGPGESTELMPNAKAEDSLGFWKMPEGGALEWKMFEFMLQLLQMATAVINGASRGGAGMPAANTATGISAVVDDASTLYSMLIRRERESAEEDVRGLVSLVQQNLNRDRAFRYLKNGKLVDASVSPEDIRDLSYDVKFTLSKLGGARRGADLQNALKVIGAWLQLPGEYQKRTRTMFIQLLGTLGMESAEQLLPSEKDLQAEQTRDEAIKGAAQAILQLAEKIQQATMDPVKVMAAEAAKIGSGLMQLAAQPIETNGEGEDGEPAGTAAGEALEDVADAVSPAGRKLPDLLPNRG